MSYIFQQFLLHLKVFYFDIEEKSDVIKMIIKDLEGMIQTLGELLEKEDVKEKYVRDFLNCSLIDKNSDIVQMDKIMFIYKYGSKKAKKIAVDERLKMI